MGRSPGVLEVGQYAAQQLDLHGARPQQPGGNGAATLAQIPGQRRRVPQDDRQRARPEGLDQGPGALTIVLRHTPSLAWDLGESRGTVAVRMPLHPVAIELLTQT